MGRIVDSGTPSEMTFRMPSHSGKSRSSSLYGSFIDSLTKDAARARDVDDSLDGVDGELVELDRLSDFGRPDSLLSTLRSSSGVALFASRSSSLSAFRSARSRIRPT